MIETSRSPDQTGETSFEPAEIRRRIEAVGRDVTPESLARSRAVYVPFHEREPYAGVTVVRDVAYGLDERQRIDLFTPPAEPGSATRPAIVFLHGGGFVAGDRRKPGTPYHDNVGLWCARHGYVGVTMSYRLAPRAQWPAGAQDVATALDWLRRESNRHGIDAQRMFLMGTSAGAAHVASFLGSPWDAPDGADDGLAGAVLISGAYDFTTFAHPGLTAYLGPDHTPGDTSPLAGLVDSSLPLLFVLAEFEPEAAEQQAARLLGAYAARHGRWPSFVRLLGHNHFTATDHLNTPDDTLGVQLELFFAGSAATGVRR